MTTLPSEQVPGLYHRRIGDVLVTAISDGYLDAPYGIFLNLPEDDARGILTSSFRPAPPRISINCFLLRTAGRIAIVDTGSGDTMGPTLGKMPARLSDLGLTTADIDTVLLTHMHPDHSNGLTGPDGERLIPNAEIVVDEKDVRHWHDDAAMERVIESQKVRYFLAARRQIAPYMDRLRQPSADVFPHVTPVPLHGHTPGHTGYLIESGGEALLIWGDICHVPEVQLRRPGTRMIFDSDADAAIATRRRVLDMAASDRLLIAGMHLHFPGLIHVVRRGGAYGMVPEGWAFTL